MKLILFPLCLAMLFINISVAASGNISRCNNQENWHGHVCSEADDMEFPGNEILGDPQDPEPSPSQPSDGGNEDDETEEGPVPK